MVVAFLLGEGAPCNYVQQVCTDGCTHIRVIQGHLRPSLERRRRISFAVNGLCFIEVAWWWKVPDDYNCVLKALNPPNILKGEQHELFDRCLVCLLCLSEGEYSQDWCNLRCLLFLYMPFFVCFITVKAGIFLLWTIPLHILILLVWSVNRNRCRTLILTSSQLPEPQNIQFNGLSSLLTPCKVFVQWTPFVKLRVIVLIVLQAPT